MGDKRKDDQQMLIYQYIAFMLKLYKVTVSLSDFALPKADLVPYEVRDKIKKCSDYIDYWAIDWNFQNDTFMNGWVALRTRKERTLPLRSEPYTYGKTGRYTIMTVIKAGDQELGVITFSVREEFIKWLHSPENNRSPGSTCLQGVDNLEQCLHWSQSGVENSKGCGSAMQAAPIGYYYQNHPEKLKEVAHVTDICTHGHSISDTSCIGAAYLVKLALDGTPPAKMVGRLLSFTRGISGEFDEAIYKVKKCLPWPNEEEALSYLGEGWVGEEAVALAIYCFLRYPNNYEKVVIRGANTNGDSDSVASIAGSFSGAYLGVKAIPQNWLKRIENSIYLNKLANYLTMKKENLVKY